MTAISVDPSILPLTQVARFTRNGRVPDSAFQRELVQLANGAAAYRGKDLFRSPGSIADFPAYGGTRNRFRFAFHSGPFCRFVGVRFVMGSLYDGAVGTAYSQLAITTTGGSAIGSAKFYGPSSPIGNKAAADVPDHFTTGTVFVAVNPDTDYLGLITDGSNGRCLSADVFEVLLPPDTATGFLENNVAQNSPIYSTDREDIMPMADTLWRRAGSSLLTWTVETDALARVAVATSADKNIIDNTSTTVATSTPGYTLDLTGKATIASGGVPVAFTAYGVQAGGLANGSGVKLKNSAGTVLADIHPPTVAGWFSTTLLLPASIAKYDLHYYATSTGGTFTLYAADLYEHL